MHYIITPSDLDCDLDETSRGDAAFAITHYVITPCVCCGTEDTNVRKNQTLSDKRKLDRRGCKITCLGGLYGRILSETRGIRRKPSGILWCSRSLQLYQRALCADPTLALLLSDPRKFEGRGCKIQVLGRFVWPNFVKNSRDSPKTGRDSLVFWLATA